MSRILIGSAAGQVRVNYLVRDEKNELSGKNGLSGIKGHSVTSL
jgi:hypothetical protein